MRKLIIMSDSWDRGWSRSLVDGWRTQGVERGFDTLLPGGLPMFRVDVYIVGGHRLEPEIDDKLDGGWDRT